MQANGLHTTSRRTRLRRWGLFLVGVLAFLAVFNLLPPFGIKARTGSQQRDGSREPPDVTALSVIWDDFNHHVILPIRLAWMVTPMIKESLDRGTGIYHSREEIVHDHDSGNVLWKWIDKPSEVVRITHDSLIEPFPSRTLAALDKVFNDAQEPAIRLHAATLLARYGREHGMNYLRAVANKGAPSDLALSAGTTLALNRDTNSLPAILRLLGGNYPESSELAKALGNWPDPSVIEALERRVVADKIKARYYAFALAKLGRDGGRVSFQHHFDWTAKQDALSSLSPRNQRYRANSIRTGGLSEEASAARIGMVSTNVFLDHVEEIYRKGLSQDWSNYVMPGFEIAGPGTSTAPLLKYLGEFAPRHRAFLAWTNPPPAVVVPGQRPPPRQYPPYPPVGFMAGAVNLLADWEVREAVPHLKEIIPTIQLNRPRWSNKVASNALNLHLGLALYKLDPEGWKETLEGAGMRQEFIERIPEIAKLRPVAPSYLPKQGDLNSR